MRDAGRAFERGDYASAGALARGVLEERPEANEELRSQATDLLERLKPDPLIRYLLAASALLLLFLALFAYAKGSP